MNKKMLYVMTPKCGSKSLRLSLMERFPGIPLVTANEVGNVNPYSVEDSDDIGESDAVMMGFWRPPIWSAHAGEATEKRDRFFNDDYYKWTVVRNPWHRLASVYEMLATNNNVNVSCCHDDLLSFSFSDFVFNVTQVPYVDLCVHSEPERFGLQTDEEKMWFDYMCGFESIKSDLPGFLPGHTYTGVGVALQTRSFRQIMKRCNRSIQGHTQRWENSNLFSGHVVIEPPDEKHIRDYASRTLGWTAYEAPLHRLAIYVIRVLQTGMNAFHTYENVGNPRPLDRVVRFEEFDVGIEQVCDDLGIETIDVPHYNNRNVTDKARHYELLYNDDLSLINAVRDWYSYEINTFGYEFGKYL